MTKRPLTPILKETLDFLTAYIEEHGFAPMQQEVADKFGVSYPTIAGRLRSLEKRGHILRYFKSPRGISLKK